MNITYFLRDDGACGYYRMSLPLDQLRRRGHTVNKVEKGDKPEYIEKALHDGDIIVVPRPNEIVMVDFLNKAKELGKKVVIDYDDDLFNVSPMSMHYEEWGTENVKIDLNGKKIKLWEDGTNINLEANRRRIQSIKDSCQSADLITVTQPILAEVYGQYGKTAELPNCLDLNLWKALNLKRDRDEIRLYWSGGASHYEDWVVISEAIRKVMDKYPKVRLVLLGMKFEGTLKGLDKKRIEYHHWVPTPAYPYFSAILNADIGIIPLRDTPFNRSKSSIKLVENGSLGVATCVSNIPPYTDFYNGKNAVMVENNTTQGWVEGLSYLIDNPLDRWNIGAEARKTVEENYDISKKAYLWEQAYEEL